MPSTAASTHLMMAKVAAANTVHDLDNVNAITGTWPLGDEHLQETALDIQLLCEATQTECRAMNEVLDMFLASAAEDPAAQALEIKCRQESAAKELLQAEQTIAGVTEAYEARRKELGVVEMRKRFMRVRGRLDGMRAAMEAWENSQAQVDEPSAEREGSQGVQ